MSHAPKEPFILTQCRTVAAGLVARAWPGETQQSVERRMSALPKTQQVGFIGAILALLFAGAFIAAQFGWIGMVVFFICVVLLVG